ncbi:hypothetical protein ABID42_003630 [Arcicella rosea]
MKALAKKANIFLEKNIACRTFLINFALNLYN